jgi:N-acetylneuraminate lyase
MPDSKQNQNMSYARLDGFIAAPFTSFHADGSIDLETIRAYAEFLKKNGASGAFILGTTGEGMSMTISERKQVAEEWMKVTTPNFKIIVHVGSSGLAVSRELATHAQEIGAYAVGCIAPNFFKPQNIDDLTDFLAGVAECCPDLPFYYYHIPSMSGVNLSMPDLLQRAPDRIPNLAGIKFTHHDLMELNRCLAAGNGRFDILHGFDEILLCGLALGVQAAVGSTYNYFLPVYLKLRDAFMAGDLEKARAMQQLSVQLVTVLIRYGGGISCGKAIMELVGVPCGPCRVPVKSLSREEVIELRNDLEKMNFFELIGMATAGSPSPTT